MAKRILVLRIEREDESVLEIIRSWTGSEWEFALTETDKEGSVGSLTMSADEAADLVAILDRLRVAN